MSSQAMGNKVVWFDVPCRDLDRAIAFYSAVLGCQIEKQGGPDFQMGVLPHEGSSVGGCLYVSPENSPSDHGMLVYLNCDQRLDAAIAAAEAHGGRVVQPKHSLGPHGWRAIVIDSEGNQVALHSM